MKKKLLAVIFLVYVLIVAAITIIPTRLPRRVGPHAQHVNLIPFTNSINCIKVTRVHTDLIPFCLRNFFGNIALFLPFGILLPLLSVRFNSAKRVILLAVFLSLSIETIQFVSRFIGSPRAVDIDDVLLNTLGACLGFGIFRLAKGIGERGGTGEG